MVHVQALPRKKGGEIYKSIDFTHTVLPPAGAICGTVGIDGLRIKIPRFDYSIYLFISKSFSDLIRDRACLENNKIPGEHLPGPLRILLASQQTLGLLSFLQEGEGVQKKRKPGQEIYKDCGRHPSAGLPIDNVSPTG